jgi:hypothetical protein
VDYSLTGLGRLSSALQDLEPILTAVGEKARDVILEEGRRDTGGDLILSHFARGRVKLAVETKFNGASLTLTATPPGPWMLLEAGSHKGSWVEPRAGRKKRVKLPDGNVRRYVKHGAVRAKQTFTRARTRIDAEAPKWFDAEVNKLIQREAA